MESQVNERQSENRGKGLIQYYTIYAEEQWLRVRESAPANLITWIALQAVLVYHVGPTGWTKLSGDDVGELHYSYYPVEPAVVEQEMTEAVTA
ncbi:hypothetical protein Tco_0989542 [Tanacetum coccineum]|uniref:Uncharacterized protein n=1 Tax=Tanacetum coccineum TaxID=301880 RepID=A0ABQ5EUI7_9ASTR